MATSTRSNSLHFLIDLQFDLDTAHRGTPRGQQLVAQSFDDGTQTPVRVVARPSGHQTSPGDRVVDPSVGRGTAITAAEKTGRRRGGVDHALPSVAAAIHRWETDTGERAERLEGGGGE